MFNQPTRPEQEKLARTTWVGTRLTNQPVSKYISSYSNQVGQRSKPNRRKLSQEGLACPCQYTWMSSPFPTGPIEPMTQSSQELNLCWLMSVDKFSEASYSLVNFQLGFLEKKKKRECESISMGDAQLLGVPINIRFWLVGRGYGKRVFFARFIKDFILLVEQGYKCPCFFQH